jgi:DNA mismatch repair protein MutL
MPDAVVIEDFRQDYLQVCQAYIIATTKNGFLLIDQHLAHQRILYERYESAQQQPIVIQKCLVPITFEVSPVDAVLLESILPSLLELGYEVEFFGQQTFIIQGTPSDIKLGNEKSSIEKLIDAYKHFASDVKLDKREKLMRTMAAQKAIWHGKKLEQSEIERLLQDLFRCEQPQLSPNGNKIFSKIQADDIERLIRNA